MLPKTSLEQWAAFKAVVDEGSFVKAAELLNKSQSSVSYALARLQERLPSPLLTQNGRKAELTELGKTLYRHANALLDQANKLDATAEYLAKGWEAEVTLAVDALVSMNRIFCALHHFSEAHPETRIRVLETTLSGTEEAVLTRTADVAIMPRVPPGFLASNWGEVTMYPVVAASHALAQQEGMIAEDELKQYRQLVIRDSGVKREQDGGWLGSDQRWTVSHFATSIEAIKTGLGFGFIPEDFIKEELASGELKVLTLAHGGIRKLPLYCLLTGQSYAGPAAKTVVEYLLQE